jgi:NAD-dependent SIR2 family protein deacetylase
MKSKWSKRRTQPYTTAGIARLKCIRCDNQAEFQWQICSDGRNFRPLCAPCDVELNTMVLNWAKHPDAKKLAKKYAEEKLGKTKPA